MRSLLFMPLDIKPDVQPETYYSFFFLKSLTLFSISGLCILLFTSISSPLSSALTMQAQSIALLFMIFLHLWTRRAIHLKLASYVFIVVLFSATVFLILTSTSGDASGAYHYPGPLVFITMFLLGPRPAWIIFSLFALFYLGMSLNVFEACSWISIPQIVPVRRQVYIDRFIEMAILLGGARVFRAISHTQALAISEKSRLNADKKNLESIQSLAGGIAHEINNPLAIIRAALDLMKRHALLDPHALRFTNYIDSASTRITDFVSCIQRLTSDSTAKMTNLPLQKTIQDIIENTIRNEKILEQARIRTAIDVPSGIAVTIDLESLSMVIQSLQTNAAEAIAEMAEGKIAWTLVKHPEAWSLTCADNGPDFDLALLPRFGEPFFTTKLDRPRRGLGLTTSRLLLVKHGWDLRWQRTAGWTQVSLLIPFHSVGERSRPAEAVQQAS